MPVNFANRSSGLDFSDNADLSSLEQHPDVNAYSSGKQLQRNKTERRRIQGLQRVASVTKGLKAPVVPTTFREKWRLWMINDGGRKMFFGVWIFLHMLVFALGMMNYLLKDNLVGARHTFGITYRAFSLL
jgi:hypothetical protein